MNTLRKFGNRGPGQWPGGPVARNMFEKWCNDNGRMDLFNSTPENKMGGHIAAVEGFELLDLKGGRPIDPVTGRQGQRRWLCVELVRNG